jgi:hypothetical protein
VTIPMKVTTPVIAVPPLMKNTHFMPTLSIK